MENESTLLRKLTAPGPKRILSLDGGGIKGIVTLGFLEKIEGILRKRYNDPDYRLCQYFDLIGGTSTGAIIASGLAIGMEVAEMKKQYYTLGKEIFGKKKGIVTYLSKAQKYDSKPIEKALKNQLGDILLGDQKKIKTGLCIVAKRADTFSTWPLINHPNGKWYDYNKDIPLWQAVRASIAAPTFFLPAYVDVGPNEKAAFIDGAISMANNPSFRLFLLSTLKGYPFHWPTGGDNLCMVSLGTGKLQLKFSLNEIKKSSVLSWATNLPEFFMADSSKMNQLILQYLSDSPTARIMDSEIGDLRKDMLGDSYLLHYLRYNVLLEKEFLSDLGFNLTYKEIKKLSEIDRVSNLSKLDEIAQKAADQLIHGRHLPTSFDPGETPNRKKKRFVTGESVDLRFSPVKKKPVIIEACKIDEPFEVVSLEGLVKGKKGDYLMKGVEGEYYICDEKIFHKTYEQAK